MYLALSLSLDLFIYDLLCVCCWAAATKPSIIKTSFFCTKTLALAMSRHHPSSCIRNSSSSIFVVVVYYNNLVSIRYCGFVGHYFEEAFTFPMQNLLTISYFYYFYWESNVTFINTWILLTISNLSYYRFYIIRELTLFMCAFNLSYFTFNCSKNTYHICMSVCMLIIFYFFTFI